MGRGSGRSELGSRTLSFIELGPRPERSSLGRSVVRGGMGCRRGPALVPLLEPAACQRPRSGGDHRRRRLPAVGGAPARRRAPRGGGPVRRGDAARRRGGGPPGAPGPPPAPPPPA